MEKRSFDRRAEDIGNIIEFGHLNVNVASQDPATTYYVTALGLTRDPYLNTGTRNMWINVGRSQFHLPTGQPQVARGVTGLIVPSLDGLLNRLESARESLKGTRFDFQRSEDGRVETTCPWGNRIDLHTPDPERFGPVLLGIAYIRFPVSPGATEKIARFYREVFGATTGGDASTAIVSVGYHQSFVFEERSDVPAYDGHHVQVYLANFSTPYEKLGELGLITRESSQHQYSFVDIVDLDSGAVVYKLDHEVRSMSHPFFGRSLVNRDPAVDQRTFKPGREALAWATA